ncbi:Conserved_hypothetical protein [Hexamita inflata]|uniref:Transmembrane protein n=1 Tax=Hexamita inflata TaxID=28002 RepID=A0AA86P377_9EUKA|nr:Conserved hypothetical protein [Hexamita inflata]
MLLINVCFQLQNAGSSIVNDQQQTTLHVTQNSELKINLANTRIVQGFEDAVLTIATQVTAKFTQLQNIILDCTGTDYCNGIFDTGVNIFNSSITNIKMTTDFSSAIIKNTTISNSVFTGFSINTQLENVKFINCQFTNVDFYKIQNVTFESCDISSTSNIFNQVTLMNVNILNSNINSTQTIFIGTAISNLSLINSNIQFKQIASSAINVQTLNIVDCLMNISTLGQFTLLDNLHIKNVQITSTSDNFSFIESAETINNSVLYKLRFNTSTSSWFSMINTVKNVNNLLIDSISLLSGLHAEVNMLCTVLQGSVTTVQINNIQISQMRLFNFSLINQATSSTITHLVFTNSVIQGIANISGQKIVMAPFKTVIKSTILSSLFQFTFNLSAQNINAIQHNISGLVDQINDSSLIDHSCVQFTLISNIAAFSNTNSYLVNGLASYIANSQVQTSYAILDFTTLAELVSLVAYSTDKTNYTNFQTQSKLVVSFKTAGSQISNFIYVKAGSSSSVSSSVTLTNSGGTFLCMSNIGVVYIPSIANCNTPVTFTVDDTLPSLKPIKAPIADTYFNTSTFDFTVFSRLNALSTCINAFRCEGSGITFDENYKLCRTCSYNFVSSYTKEVTSILLAENKQYLKVIKVDLKFICPLCHEFIGSACVLAQQCEPSKTGYLDLYNEARIIDADLCKQTFSENISSCTAAGLTCLNDRGGSDCGSFVIKEQCKTADKLCDPDTCLSVNTPEVQCNKSTCDTYHPCNTTILCNASTCNTDTIKQELCNETYCNTNHPPTLESCKQHVSTELLCSTNCAQYYCTNCTDPTPIVKTNSGVFIGLFVASLVVIAIIVIVIICKEQKKKKQNKAQVDILPVNQPPKSKQPRGNGSFSTDIKAYKHKPDSVMSRTQSQMKPKKIENFSRLSDEVKTNGEEPDQNPIEKLKSANQKMNKLTVEQLKMEQKEKELRDKQRKQMEDMYIKQDSLSLSTTLKDSQTTVKKLYHGEEFDADGNIITQLQRNQKK